MSSPSFRDIEQLSAYLDGQLSRDKRARLEVRIQADPALSAALEEIRQTRALLRRTPQRRAPRNFRLTPKMVGIRPPVPRLVPVLSWASAVAMLLFIFTLGTSLVGQLSSSGTAAPMLAAAPNGFGAGQAPAATAAPATMAPAFAAPATSAPATAAPAPIASATPPAANDTMPAPTTLPATATAQVSAMSAAEATPPPAARLAPYALATKAAHSPLSLWLFIWPGLAVLLGILAILIHWLNKRSFQQKYPRG
jgi:anti-sigma factor RsiW